MFSSRIPLAERMRPANLDGMIGQEHLVGAGSVLRKAISKGVVPSMILWGPPGVGKTTLGQIIANEVKSHFVTLSAISAGVKDVRDVISKAAYHSKTILFIDEIHRFNKSQQDALLGAVEKGTITLIGATTENPSFEVNSALLSRCQVYILKSLGEKELNKIVEDAIVNDEFLKEKEIEVKETNALFQLSGGDARKLLNLLELVTNDSEDQKVEITDERVVSVAQQKVAAYDKSGEMHYDIISAFIKSIRGSDPNAAVYWLARMITGGEDVKFIARRMLILASEDIGNANPTALVMANECFQAVNVIGYPEAQIVLSQCATYLASSPKSNASYVAINKAVELVEKEGELPVPFHLRNAPTWLMKKEGYGKGYKYAHNFENNFVKQEFLPEKLEGYKLFDPGKNPREEEMRRWLKKLWEDKYNY